jgi:hypothetical protein
MRGPDQSNKAWDEFDRLIPNPQVVDLASIVSWVIWDVAHTGECLCHEETAFRETPRRSLKAPWDSPRAFRTEAMRWASPTGGAARARRGFIEVQ